MQEYRGELVSVFDTASTLTHPDRVGAEVFLQDLDREPDSSRVPMQTASFSVVMDNTCSSFENVLKTTKYM